MTRIIEFVGVPCSGKSTLSHLLSEELSKTSMVDERQYIHSHLSSSLRRIVIKCAYSLLSICCHPVKFVKLLFKGYPATVLFNYAYIDWLTNNQKRIVVLEQGVCQLVMSLFEGKKADSQTVKERLVNLFTKQGDITVVIVDANLDEIKFRIKKRGNNDLPNIAKNGNVDETIINSNDVLGYIEQTLKQLGCSKVIRIKNVNDTQGEVIKELQALL